ncbi:MAG: 3-dehydroquinate synthase [Coriobacteriaceae bacterium]|nr:3-dehydroquinate synthase [Coriobacteriaceae bacterium]
MTAPAYSIDINTPQPYRVLVGTFLLEQIGELTRGVCESASRALIISDSNVAPLYAAPVSESLKSAGFATSIATFEAGENQKNMRTYGELLDRCADEQLTRSDVIIALGGGVVGDMAGFVAATYMRGIPFIQVPTTLLAMVDSSVGGKTAVDLESGKNLAGAFWQPRLVVADIGCLGTLSDEQFADGCGEVIKHAMIADADLFDELERTPLTLELVKTDLARAAWLIARNIDIKRAVVVEDERESGLRKLLNFGHTIGHGVEAAANYALGHGTCVGIGMVAIASASVTAGVCDEGVPERLARLLHAHGLELACDAADDDVYESALHDKKRAGDHIDLVVPRVIGAASLAPTPLDEFRRILEVGLACAKALSEEITQAEEASC